MDKGIRFGLTQRGQRKLIDSQGYTYVRRRERKSDAGVSVEYWGCTTILRKPHKRTCPGTFHYFPESQEGRVVRAHWEDELTSTNKATRITYDRLKELTLAAENGTRPIEIVNKMIEEIPPEKLGEFPNERALIKRVQRYAKMGGVVLARNNCRDDDDDEKDSDSAVASNTGSGGGGLAEKKALLGSKWRKDAPVPRLTLVDEEGRDMTVPVDMIVTAGEEGQSSQACLDYESLPRISSAPVPTSGQPGLDEDEETAYFDDSNDFMNDDGPEPDGDDFECGGSEVKGSTKARTVFTSSKVKSASKRPLKEAVKSGEKCFVCGDDILVSEASSSSQEMFRKVCTYLNVKSENEWFPRKSNGQFYSFCELCTNEITRIQQLYKNVEEKQSLIFKKVQQLEKLIADGEIMDNWLAEASISKAKRFEGFRKQVLINYKNKLKLRREMRMGTKLGHDFLEIQPITSAHMFASDPSETDAFRKVVKTSSRGDSKNIPIQQPGQRKRGRPKSSKTQEELVEKKPEPIHHFSNQDQVKRDHGTISFGQEEQDDNDDDGGDFLGFDDTPYAADDDDDAMSVGSEKERKFWEDDLNKLKLHLNNDNLDLDAGDNDWENEADNQSDSDDDLDDDDDEDWGKSKSKTRRNTIKTATPTKKRRGRPPTKTASISSSAGTDLQTKSAKLMKGNQTQTVKKSKQVSKPKALAQPTTEKPKRKFHLANIEFPDVVLTKEGRMFLCDIEIIKNPPGTYNGKHHELSFTCGACGRVIPDIYQTKSHVCGFHIKMYKCNVCGRQLGDARNLKRHMETRHSNAPLVECPICSKPLKARNQKTKTMKNHIWLHLSEEEKKDPKYESYCPTKFLDPHRIKRKSALSTYQCPNCPQTFHRMDTFRKHELIHAREAGAPEETFQCQFCGKLYKLAKSLREHNRSCGVTDTSVESRLTYPCPVCLVPLKSHKLRRIHMRKFHGSNPTSSLSQPFGCPKCPRRFQTKKAFKAHKRICGGGGAGGGSNPQQRGGDMDESSNSRLSATSEGNQFKVEAVARNPSIVGGGGGYRDHHHHHEQSGSMFSANSSDGNPNNPVQMPSSSAALPVGFSYNLFGGYHAPAGNGFQAQHHHHQQQQQ